MIGAPATLNCRNCLINSSGSIHNIHALMYRFAQSLSKHKEGSMNNCRSTTNLHMYNQLHSPTVHKLQSGCVGFEFE